MSKDQKYVDGFVLVVPKKNLKEYRKMAAAAGRVWKKYGALDYKECVEEDPHPNMGSHKILSFRKMTKVKKNEVVMFSYITYKSRQHRDQVNTAVSKDPMMNDPKNKDMKMPFDLKKMAYAGFKVIVDAS